MKRVEKSVFISYRRTDGSWALNIYKELSRRGFDVFFDFNSIGSGSFADIIFDNIRSRAHFLVVLTPTALDRCTQPDDWLRQEIEEALVSGRNVVPIMIGDFRFGTPAVKSLLTGKLASLSEYNGIEMGLSYFDAAIERLATQFLDIPTDAVIHPASTLAMQSAKQQQAAADGQLKERFRRAKSKSRQLAVELAETKELLSQFQCPKCGALQTEHGFGSRPHHSGYDEEWEYASYECGYAIVDDKETRLCRNSVAGREQAKIKEVKFSAAIAASTALIRPYGDPAKAELLAALTHAIDGGDKMPMTYALRAEAHLSTGNAHEAIKDIYRSGERGGLQFADSGPLLKAMIYHIKTEWARAKAESNTTARPAG